MHPFAFKFKRRFVRYRLQRPDILQGSLGPLNPSFRLVTIGRGGAGFLSMAEGRELSPPMSISCHFYAPSLGSEALEIEADLLYSVLDKSAVQERVYYGVEFRDKTDEKILKILELLKSYQKSGAVVLDHH